MLTACCMHGSWRDGIAGCTAQPVPAPVMAPSQPLDAPATLEGAASMNAPAASPVAAPLQVTCPHLVPIIFKGHMFAALPDFILKLKTGCPDAAARHSNRQKPPEPFAWLC